MCVCVHEFVSVLLTAGKVKSVTAVPPSRLSAQEAVFPKGAAPVCCNAACINSGNREIVSLKNVCAV